MVARIATGKSIHGVLHYNEQKVQEGKAELILASRFLQSPADLTFQQKLRRFRRLQEMAPRVKTNVLHISLNFHPTEQLTDIQYSQIAASYMQRIGFGEQPYLVYRHHDAGHPHLHLVTTNITRDGKRINTHNIGREKSEQARKAIEQEFGLLPAQGNAIVAALPRSLDQLEKVWYGQEETRQGIARVVHTILKHFNVTSLPELNVVLRQYNITADQGSANSLMHRRKGLVYSILGQDGQKAGVPLKASSLPGRPTLAKLEKQFSYNRQHRPFLCNVLRTHVTQALHQADRDGPPAFLQHLNRAGIQVLFRESARGQVYGATFLDYRNRAVINGRELGKAYGARQLLARLSRSQQGEGVVGTPRTGEITPAIKPRGVAPTSRGILPPATQPENVIRELLEARQEPAYLPAALKRKKRKRKKRYQTL
ncbi:relaxase/mobilization nuclease domain-containing protein [Pontibacter sp. Tf4]|uniref:relaxase/mobilization nuclease domain-containing protein n=1 Tax=Pontibacter sp. Tf4 TaxID=2761620 RepID=UPI0016254795|nr:relaxase/mobilization nuclease domain-containing protein [Pontibacter sp. Tf4]MBB6611805.1 relaxase/mobilization nuclease domain-containing protein [Pontibacter sp. Tf4]